MATPSPIRRPFPQFNAFRPFVMEELRRRKTVYPNPMSAPFVRLTSAKHDPDNNYIFFTLGLHGFSSADVDIFNVSYGGGVDVVGYASDLTSPVGGRSRKRLIHSGELTAGLLPSTIKESMSATDPTLMSKVQRDINRQIGNQKIVYAGGAHPIPGITNVSVKRSGLGTPLIAKIQWSCYNRSQLEFLRNHFMVAGGYCVIEFGQNFHDRGITKTIDFQNPTLARTELVNSILKGRGYIIDNYVAPNNGNYDFLVGTIGNYEIELDAKTGVYNCTTTLVSVGEEAWGLNNHMTVVKKNVPASGSNAYAPTSFHDFFNHGGEFDRLVESDLAARQYQYVADYSVKTDKLFGGDAFKGYSNNAHDYRFVSWKFVCERMIPKMMSLISDEGIKKNIEYFIKFYNTEADVENPDNQAWVGNHKDLRSTNPDIMLLIKSDMKDVPREFIGAGYFDEFSNAQGFRGKLDRGVWLNAGMIRQCFLETLTFQPAINSILIRMNSATGGYWGLQLFFDSETSQYKIVDTKHMDGRTKTLPSFYKFNVGGKGEMLNVSLDSSFPPELVTQLMLYAKFKNETQETQRELIKQYPAIGTTSTFAISLNWTSLVDVLNIDITKARESTVITSASRTIHDLLVPAKGPSTTQTQNDRIANRVAGANITNIGAPAVSNRTSPNPGVAQRTMQPVVLPQNKSLPINTFPSGSTRNSVKPPTTRPSVVKRADQFKVLVNEKASKHGVDPDLVNAVIAQESGFSSAASRTELLLGDSSKGLMQITLGTARGLGYTGSASELSSPENSVEYGTAYLAECMRAKNGNIEDAISMYNGGDRPRLGFGSPASAPVKVCLQWSQTKKGECEVWRECPPGQYGNKPHVDKVVGYYNAFRADSGKAPFTGRTTNGTLQPDATDVATQQARRQTPNPTGTPAQAPNPQAAQAIPSQSVQDAAKIDSITTRFGQRITNIIAPSTSTMVNVITRSGYSSYPTPNSFVAPFPTSTAVEVQLQGISGISISDAFLVDRLPFIFERYGVFQVTEMTDSVNERGWTTKLRGYFKMIWLHGDGPDKSPET